MLKILIVEEALKNRVGHWYEYNCAIVEEARRQGHHVTVLAHCDIEPDIQEELDAEAFFPITSWDLGYNHPKAWRRYLGILRHNLSLARLLRRHFMQQKEPYDIVLTPTVVLYHWLAWRWLVFRGAGRWFNRVVLTTRNNAGEYDATKQGYVFNSSAKVLAFVLKSFRKPVSLGYVEMASDSSRLAEQYEGLCGIPFQTYPHPRPTDHLSFPKAKEKTELVFSALGPPRYEKGSDLIVGAINRILRENPDFPGRFVIHWNISVFSPDGSEISLPNEWQDHPKIELIRESLSSEDYQRRIEEASILLVPYRRSQYRARLSGISIEAFQSGIPCICVSDTWVADCMNEIGAGIALSSETVDSLYDGIHAIADKGATVIAKERIELAREFHSPKAFVERLTAGGNFSV